MPLGMLGFFFEMGICPGFCIMMMHTAIMLVRLTTSQGNNGSRCCDGVTTNGFSSQFDG
jgi:hypothetical protein